MSYKLVAAVIILATSVTGQQTLEAIGKKCKNPIVEQRRMADDVRYASPFYVLALPRTPKTEQIDNVCYTYYENEAINNSFFHVMSIVYKNQSNSYYKLSKQDIFDRNGLAEAKGEVVSSCTYHDYTLVPICNFTVFILYRCYIEGDCKDADIGDTKGVDVRVVLAASTSVSDICKQEIDASLKDTSVLAGGDYLMLPQVHKPQCITSFGNRKSINPNNALGSISVQEENNILNRLGDEEGASFGGFAPSSGSPAAPSNSAQFLVQHTPITNTPKKTYADAVKTPKIKSSQGMNVVHYEENHKHEHSEFCSCS